MNATVLHASDSLSAIEFRCTARRHEQPFTELHDAFTIAYVRHGTFGCRSEPLLAIEQR